MQNPAITLCFLADKEKTNEKLPFFRTLSLPVATGAGKGLSVFLISAADILKGFDEVIKNFGRNHDSVAVGAYLFSNAYYTASGVALEVDEECFAVCNDFFCTNDIVVHCCK